MKIGSSLIGIDEPTYFVADIAANHDGNINRAIELIHRCAEAGANAAKFQNFKASTIVSDYGFKSLQKVSSHQSGWKDSVYQVYDQASISLEWTQQLKEACENDNIDYFTAPYDLDIIDYLDDFVSAWKVGSGDINWLDLIENLAQRGKPLLIATGASSLEDVRAAIKISSQHSSQIVLMQCNTNYTGSLENLKHVNLSVLSTYSELFPGMILGLSDHTPGHSTVLGAIALGARVIEKHFTDDTSRNGPDHKFSMNPDSWREMVVRSRELESALGDGVKKVEDNESETFVIQRRALRAAKDLPAGTILNKSNVVALRPCPAEGLGPNRANILIGRLLSRPLVKGEIIGIEDLST